MAEWFTKIRYAMDMLAENPKNFIASVLLCGVGLSLIGFNLLVYLAGNHSYKSAEDVLSQGIEHTGILEVLGDLNLMNFQVIRFLC